jgi:hypothetical protein
MFFWHRFLSSILVGLGFDFGSLWAPFWEPKSVIFGIDFLMIFACRSEIAPRAAKSCQEPPKSSPRAPKSGPRGAQERPKTAQERPREPQERQKVTQEGPRRPKRKRKDNEGRASEAGGHGLALANSSGAFRSLAALDGALPRMPGQTLLQQQL